MKRRGARIVSLNLKVRDLEKWAGIVISKGAEGSHFRQWQGRVELLTMGR